MVFNEHTHIHKRAEIKQTLTEKRNCKIKASSRIASHRLFINHFCGMAWQHIICINLIKNHFHFVQIPVQMNKQMSVQIQHQQNKKMKIQNFSYKIPELFYSGCKQQPLIGDEYVTHYKAHIFAVTLVLATMVEFFILFRLILFVWGFCLV